MASPGMPVNRGWYAIMNALTGTFVDLGGGSTEDGHGVFSFGSALGNDGAQKNQCWQFLDQGDGTWKIKNANGQSVLNLSEASNVPGTKVQGWSDNNRRDGSLWALETDKIGPAGAVVTRFRNVTSSTYMDLPGGSSSPGTQLLAYNSSRGSNLHQAWFLIPLNL